MNVQKIFFFYFDGDDCVVGGLQRQDQEQLTKLR